MLGGSAYGDGRPPPPPPRPSPAAAYSESAYSDGRTPQSLLSAVVLKKAASTSTKPPPAPAPVLSEMTVADYVLPSWAVGVSSSMCTRVKMQPPGSAENPLVIRKTHFCDSVVETSDYVHVNFTDCIFERAPIVGDFSRATYVRCTSPDPSGPRGKVRMAVPGTLENPIVFFNMDFAHARLSLGDVHARFSHCLFIRCEIDGAENCIFTESRFTQACETYVMSPYVFYCLNGETIVFGEVFCELDPSYVHSTTVEEMLEQREAAKPKKRESIALKSARSMKALQSGAKRVAASVRVPRISFG